MLGWYADSLLKSVVPGGSWEPSLMREYET